MEKIHMKEKFFYLDYIQSFIKTEYLVKRSI